MRIRLIIVCTLALNANFVDNDLDGVDDSIDKCPNTELFDIVDKYGCTTKKLKPKQESKIEYSLSLGYFYTNDTVTNKSYSLNFSLNYKNFNAFIETSKYNVDNQSGIDDTTIALFYTFKGNFDYTFGAGAYLPTSDTKDNKTDYFAKLKISYSFNDFDAYISYQKTFNKDKDSYNIDSYSFSLGYDITKNLYTSISYTKNNFNGLDENSQYFSFFTNYYINNNIYLSATYTKGLNKNSIDKSFYFTVGYDF